MPAGRPGRSGPTQPDPADARGAPGPKRTPRPEPVDDRPRSKSGDGSHPVSKGAGVTKADATATASKEPNGGAVATAGRIAPPPVPLVGPRRQNHDDTVVAPRPVARPSGPAVLARQADPPAQASTPDDRQRRGRRGRRVHRVIRRIELWSVLKLSLVLYTCLYLAVLATLAVIWGLAYSGGQIENLQKFLADVGLENYRFYGDQMFRACAAIGAVGVLAGTVITVLTAALVNVISEMTGGIRLVVIEEEPLPGR